MGIPNKKWGKKGQTSPVRKSGPGEHRKFGSRLIRSIKYWSAVSWNRNPGDDCDNGRKQCLDVEEQVGSVYLRDFCHLPQVHIAIQYWSELHAMAVSYAPTKLRVPPGFQNLLEGLAREVLREQPPDIVSFAAQYFKSKLVLREGEFRKTLTWFWVEGRRGKRWVVACIVAFAINQFDSYALFVISITAASVSPGQFWCL